MKEIILCYYLVSPFMVLLTAHGCLSLGVFVTVRLTKTRAVSSLKFKVLSTLCNRKFEKQVHFSSTVLKYLHFFYNKCYFSSYSSTVKHFNIITDLVMVTSCRQNITFLHSFSTACSKKLQKLHKNVAMN